MDKDLELWALTLLVHANWRERSAWFNTRVGAHDRHLSALRRAAFDVIEDQGPHTLDDARFAIRCMRTTLDDIEARLKALVALRRHRLRRGLPRPPAAAHRHR